MCYGISADKHTISMVSEDCSSDFITGESFVGHRSNSWLFVQEVEVEADIGNIEQLSDCK